MFTFASPRIASRDTSLGQQQGKKVEKEVELEIKK
jgi:hypothetical protein